MWFVYTMEYYSAIKKNEILPFASAWIQLEIIIQSQKEKDKYYISLIRRTQNMTQMKLSMKQKQTHRYREQTYDSQGSGGREGMGIWSPKMQSSKHRIDKQQGLTV